MRRTSTTSSLVATAAALPLNAVLKVAVLPLTLLVAAPVAAQTLWDAPPLVSPGSPAGVSLFVLSPAGGDLGGLVTFRHDAGPVGLGYRFSISDEDASNGVAFAGGVDISGVLTEGVEDAPLDVMWWSGAGIGIGQSTVVSVPLGLLVGWSGEGNGVLLSPYAGGHVTLDMSNNDTDNVRFGGSFDLGLDLVLSSGWMIRFGGSFGDRDALALGMKLQT